MSAFLVIAAVGLGTYLLRASMFALVATKPLPRRAEAALGLVGPAAVAALVATLVLARSGSVDPGPAPELAAIAVGFVAVRRTGNVLHAFALGLPVFWVLSALAG
ncbi:MAG: AzlD domain-containing protein [Acidimicrobiia bacterium]|nr:AzlD domain-containing protein [Acidimicrobiia bacterium]